MLFYATSHSRTLSIPMGSPPRRSSIDAFVEVIVAIVNVVLIVAIVVIEAMEVKVNDWRCQCGRKRGDLTAFCCWGDSMCVWKAKWRQAALYA